MARHKGGWVKFWRKAALGDINSNYTRGGLFGALIAMANIQESTVSWDGKPRKLNRGQIATSNRELAELGGVDAKTVARHLSYLQLRDTIKVEKCSTGTIITFNNYEEYSGLDAEGPTRAPRDRDNDRPAIGIHNEEVKNKRNKEYIRESKDSLPEIAVVWNEIVKSLPKVQDWTEKRRKSVIRFLKSKTIDDWKSICAKVEASDFLSGRNGKWTSCSFDWVLKPENLTKVAEGNYDGRQTPTFDLSDINWSGPNGGGA